MICSFLSLDCGILAFGARSHHILKVINAVRGYIRPRYKLTNAN